MVTKVGDQKCLVTNLVAKPNLFSIAIHNKGCFGVIKKIHVSILKDVTNASK
jgi:hypothetical protein